MTVIEPQGESQGEEPQIDSDSLASGFLKNIPDQDRPYVEKYIKEWDAGVTKKFQGIHEQYKPYKELGDIQRLQQAVHVASLLEEQPEVVYEVLAKEFGQQMSEQQQPAQPQPTQPQQQFNWPQQPGGEQAPQQPNYKNPEYEQQLGQLNEIVRTMAQAVTTMHQQQQAQAEDKELTTYMNSLHQKYGEFDEDFILLQMHKGMDGDKAVEAFKGLGGTYFKSSYNGPKPPPSLSGGSALPRNDIDLGRISNDQTQDLVVQFLEGAREP